MNYDLSKIITKDDIRVVANSVLQVKGVYVYSPSKPLNDGRVFKLKNALFMQALADGPSFYKGKAVLTTDVVGPLRLSHESALGLEDQKPPYSDQPVHFVGFIAA